MIIKGVKGRKNSDRMQAKIIIREMEDEYVK